MSIEKDFSKEKTFQLNPKCPSDFSLSTDIRGASTGRNLHNRSSTWNWKTSIAVSIATRMARRDGKTDSFTSLPKMSSDSDLSGSTPSKFYQDYTGDKFNTGSL